MGTSIEAGKIWVFTPRAIQARGEPSVFQYFAPNSRVRLPSSDFLLKLAKTKGGKPFLNLD
jgi:hypothetical protein